MSDDRDDFPVARAAIDAGPWPDGASAAVSLTFDLDVESGLVGRRADWAHRLTPRSEQRFGADRGLGRALRSLGQVGAPATFYVPGSVALRHPKAIETILEHGHEVAHHGHDHLTPSLHDLDVQRDEIVRGSQALESVTGIRPIGYRAPAWELTPHTLAVIAEQGFAFDSSLMEDDRPYALGVGARRLIELPVHWMLDDVPHFQWSADRRAQISAPAQVLELWIAELRSACRDGRHLTYTMHPNVIGRGALVDVLDGLLAAVVGAGAWVCTHAQLVERLRPSQAVR
jgi:peptidoglycan-N-acetylglucosamine deacetylase